MINDDGSVVIEGRGMRHSLPCLIVVLGVLVSASQLHAGDCMDLSGKWDGEWVSATNGHHGSLHARLTRVSDTCYQARFHGTFFKVVPFIFGATLSVTGEDDGKVSLCTSKRLPFFGKFDLAAQATPCDFTATFSSKNDQGQFNLHRR
jgi:hypothetical protein